jgi:hypothetical protein
MIDPATPPHIVTALAALAGAFIGSVGGAVSQLLVQWRKNVADRELAKQKFAYERQQAAFKRRFELAEQALADAYQFRDLMTYVRNGAVFEGEGTTREKKPLESKNESHKRATYFVPIERLQARSEFIGTMMARRSACYAHFGENADKAYTAFQRAIQFVTVAASMLGDLDPDHPNDDKDLRNQLLGDIWQPHAEYKGTDRVEREINTGVELIEGFCIPVLRKVDSADT